eukprot:TRINITY_DN2754_c0_g1_i1.p1 TRINITY_DN2754_c0_g1~~TRINITY_DN2754_c0_g1_i1.p1  ORF type:complete len:441 (-),score=168.45 TRINITY_DN2754_c0_g1_i1:59-1381(-)
MSYSSPPLPVSEICSCLAEIGIHLTPDDFGSGNESTYRALFEGLVECLVGFRSNAPPSFSSLEHLTYRELYDEAIPEIGFLNNFFRLVQTACIGTGAESISTRNIASMKKSEMISLLSNIINFMMFRDERASTVQGWIQESEDLKENRKKLDNEVNAIESQLEFQRDRREREAPIIETLNADIAARAEELCVLNDEQSELANFKDKLVLDFSAATEKLNQTKFEISTMRQETHKLKSQLVDDPEQLKQDVLDRRARLEALKAELAAEERFELELGARLASVSRVEKEMNKAVKMLEECGEELERNRSTKKQTKVAKAKVVGCEKKLKELNSNELHAQKQLQFSKEKSERMAKTSTEKREEREQTLKKCLREKAELERQRMATMGMLDQNAQAKAQIQQKTESLRKQHELEMVVVAKKYDELESRLKEYHSNFFAAVKATN